MSSLAGSFWRLLARLIGFVLMLALALAGLAIAVFSIEAGPDGLSIPGLADLLNLSGLREEVGSLLGQLETSGIDLKPALAGLAAMLVGALLLAGILAGRRETVFSSDPSEEGTIEAERRPLAAAAERLTAGVSGVSTADVRARPSRNGGSLRVRASHPRPRSSEKIKGKVESALEPIRDAFGTKVNVRARPGEKSGRVE